MMNPTRFNVFTIGQKSVKSLKKLGETFNRKFGGTFIGRSVTYLKNVLKDYKDVASQVQADIKKKPGKSVLFFGGAGSVLYSLSHNPNEQSFKAKFVQSANDLSLISSQLANPEASDYLRLVQLCYNKDLIRYTNFGIFSIIWMDKYSNECNMYENNCSYLQVPYIKVASRILDVGFWNIWWIISRKMLDYDINY